NGDRLVQAYTDERGHTAQSAPELTAALDAVMQWIEKGTKPTSQTIAAACAQLRASLEGRCSYHPEFEPKPYGTRYARGAAINWRFSSGTEFREPTRNSKWNLCVA